MQIHFDNEMAGRHFGKARLARIKRCLAKIEIHEATKGRRTSCSIVTFTVQHHSEHGVKKMFGSMVSVFVNGSISASQGYSVRYFTSDVRGGSGLRKPQVLDRVVEQLEKVVDQL